MRVCVGDSCNVMAVPLQCDLAAGHRRYGPSEKGKINGPATRTGCDLSLIHAGLNLLWQDGLCLQYMESVFVSLCCCTHVLRVFPSDHIII